MSFAKMLRTIVFRMALSFRLEILENDVGEWGVNCGCDCRPVAHNGGCAKRDESANRSSQVA